MDRVYLSEGCYGFIDGSILRYLRIQFPGLSPGRL